MFLEIPGCINRYHAALMRNVYLGDPPEQMVKATEAMVAALREAIAFINPGITAHDAHEFCRRIIAEADLGVTMDHRAAYPIGIGFAPDSGEGQIISIKKRERRLLQAGMTFHLIPLVFIPGLASVGVSETVLVTETGCESLTGNVEPRLFVR